MAVEKGSPLEGTSKKFYKKPLFWVIAIILFIAVVAPGGEGQNNSAEITNMSSDTSVSEVDESKKEETISEPVESTETVSQKNAVKKAKSYLGFGGFSRDGLVAQLEFEKFSTDDAVYGADNSGADWNVEAEQKAKSYMEYSSFSRQGLIDQLIYEKFTPEQASRGADSVGL